MHIEPTDSCVLFNASSLQCLRCKMTCPSACVHAVRARALECTVGLHSLQATVKLRASFLHDAQHAAALSWSGWTSKRPSCSAFIVGSHNQRRA